MALKFCQKCKTLMSPKKKDNEFFMKCDNCGCIDTLSHSLSVNEKIKRKKKIGKGIAEGENEFATYDNKCKKCGYGKAQIIDAGIYYSDEDNLILLKCGKCGFSERIGRRIC